MDLLIKRGADVNARNRYGATVRGIGKASLTVEGDVDWISPESISLSGESVIEIPVRPKRIGEVPVRVVLKSLGREDSRIIWLKAEERAKKCPECGAQVEPGAKNCWRCGAKLS